MRAHLSRCVSHPGIVRVSKSLPTVPTRSLSVLPRVQLASGLGVVGTVKVRAVGEDTAMASLGDLYVPLHFFWCLGASLYTPLVVDAIT